MTYRFFIASINQMNGAFHNYLLLAVMGQLQFLLHLFLFLQMCFLGFVTVFRRK